MCLRMERKDLLPCPLIPQAGQNLEQTVGVRLSMALWHSACMQQGSLVSAQYWPKASGPEFLYTQPAQGMGNGVTACHHP